MPVTGKAAPPQLSVNAAWFDITSFGVSTCIRSQNVPAAPIFQEVETSMVVTPGPKVRLSTGPVAPSLRSQRYVAVPGILTTIWPPKLNVVGQVVLEVGETCAVTPTMPNVPPETAVAVRGAPVNGSTQ